MRIAFITSRFPFPPHKGDKIRAYYPIKYLSRRHEIDLYSFDDEGITPEAFEEMQRYCQSIHIVKINRFAWLARLAIGVFTLVPSQVYCYRSRAMQRLLEQHITREKYDVMHIVCGRLADYAKYNNGVITTADWIDALSLSTQRLYEIEKNRIKKLLYYLEYIKMKKFELSSINLFDYSIITSQVDRLFLENKINEVLPNGVDLDHFFPETVDKDIDLIFTGNMSYAPNVNAVEFFCREVMKLIQQERQGTTFYIAGINPCERVLRYHNGKTIFVTGFVENMPALLNRSKVFIAPLTSGAGIQNKILEAMACGLPVVTTSIGNGGIRGQAGEHLVVADEPKEIAVAIMKMLENEALRKVIGESGRNLVNQSFSWDGKVKRLEDIFMDLLPVRG